MSKYSFLYRMNLPHRANKNGKCWPGIRTIARELKLSQSAVRRALNDLRKEKRSSVTVKAVAPAVCFLISIADKNNPCRQWGAIPKWWQGLSVMMVRVGELPILKVYYCRKDNTTASYIQSRWESCPAMMVWAVRVPMLNSQLVS